MKWLMIWKVLTTTNCSLKQMLINIIVFNSEHEHCMDLNWMNEWAQMDHSPCCKGKGCVSEPNQTEPWQGKASQTKPIDRQTLRGHKFPPAHNLPVLIHQFGKNIFVPLTSGEGKPRSKLSFNSYYKLYNSNYEQLKCVESLCINPIVIWGRKYTFTRQAHESCGTY